MRHISVPISEVELIPLENGEFSPLISKCLIKVCYVGDEPNRNKSIITKEVATQFAPSLRGAMIAGCYIEEKKDFDAHTREVEICDGEVRFKDMTKPYGFVDLNAKVWFQKFLDDGQNEREYLMTEGYLWTGQLPEAQRVIDKGNNQSMELDEEKTKASWAKGDNNGPSFFIINETIISKLCILGEDVEPCFEGASIEGAEGKQLTFSFEPDFREQFFSLMEQMKTILDKGGTKMDNKVEDVMIEEAAAIEEAVAVENTLVVEEAPAAEFAEKDEAEEEVCPECGKPLSECECEKEKDEPKKYNLDEVVEYTDLLAQYETLKQDYDTKVSQYNDLNSQVETLTAFKKSVERKEKEAMIKSFYMLSDEDKQSVVDNIDNYSLDDIEAKLSILCVRNKVNFNLEDDSADKTVTTFALNSDYSESSVPGWIKAARATASQNY